MWYTWGHKFLWNKERTLLVLVIFQSLLWSHRNLVGNTDHQTSWLKVAHFLVWLLVNNVFHILKNIVKCNEEEAGKILCVTQKTQNVYYLAMFFKKDLNTLDGFIVNFVLTFKLNSDKSINILQIISLMLHLYSQAIQHICCRVQFTVKPVCATRHVESTVHFPWERNMETAQRGCSLIDLSCYEEYCAKVTNTT